MNLPRLLIGRWARSASGSDCCCPSACTASVVTGAGATGRTSRSGGKDGILDWMEKNDMRPGNLVTPPEKEAQHLQQSEKAQVS